MMKRRSLAFKLIVYLSGSCLLMGLAIFGVNYQYSKKMIQANIEENARNLTMRTVNRIETVVFAVQKIPENVAYSLENSTMDEKQMLAMLRTVTLENREIVGAGIFLSPSALQKNMRAYSIYCFKLNGELKIINWGDYFLEDWYQIPYELKKPEWSEPYIDKDTKILMATYSVPFYRNIGGKRQFAGVVTADISLEWLQSVVSSIKVLKTGDAFLISRNGTIITDQVKSFIMNETIFSVAEARGDSTLRSVGRKMIHGESGFVPFTSLALLKKTWMYFAPVPSTGWSLGVNFPEAEFMADITNLDHLIAALGITGLVLLVLVIATISRSITRPLRGMAVAAEAIGAGNLDTELPAAVSEDEVGRLSKAFGYMQTSLKQYIKDLKETTAVKERIESELMIAQEIQSSMLPRIFPAFPDRKEIDLFATMEPAKEVGGDFYDFFFVSESKLFFLIGDVSGKGVPAALFMMITKTLMKNEALQQLPPDQVLSKVNSILALDNDSSMFATVFCGVLDTETGEIQYSNAGHNPPLLARKGQPIEFLKVDHGFVLGPMPGSKFTLQEIRLQPGDLLFTYTDGVTEAMNTGKQLFSEKRLVEFLSGKRGVDVTELIQTLRDELKRYAQDEPQSDDITMLALKYNGSTNQS